MDMHSIRLPRSACHEADRYDFDALCCVGHYVDRVLGATKRLYVTSAWGASKVEEIKHEGITLVVNVNSLDTETALKDEYKRNGINFDHMSMEDIDDQPIEYTCKKAMASSDNTPGSTLIHCQMGISRSVAVACYIMMSRSKDSLDTVIDDILSTRSRASPNLGFMCQLGVLEKTMTRCCVYVKI